MLYDKLRDKIDMVLQLHIDCGDPSTFVVGKLLGISEKWVVLRLISTIGMWDGLGLFPLDDVISFELETQYIKKLAKLLKIRKNAELPIIHCTDDLLTAVVDNAYLNRSIVALELYKSGQRDVIGYISKHDTCLSIEVINDFGEPDGVQYVESSSITRIYCDDAELNCLELLSGSSADT